LTQKRSCYEAQPNRARPARPDGSVVHPVQNNLSSDKIDKINKINWIKREERSTDQILYLGYQFFSRPQIPQISFASLPHPFYLRHPSDPW
jgi:hypothetical protein